MQPIVVVLGIDSEDRTHASSFPLSHRAIAQRAAANMGFAAIVVNDPALIDLAARLPMGKLIEPAGYASPVDQETYAALAALIGTPAEIGNTDHEQ